MESQPKFKNRLSFKQAKNTVIIAFLMGMVFSVFQIMLDFFASQQETGETIQQALRSFEQPASQAAYTLDSDIARELLVGIFEYKSVLVAKILDDEGNELASIDRAPLDQQLRWLTELIFGASETHSIPLQATEVSLDMSLIGQPVKAGELSVVVDTYPAGLRFLQRATVILGSGLLRNFLLSLVLLVFFHFYLTKPFLNLEEALINVDPQNPNQYRLESPKGHQQDEFGMLVDTTNHLLAAIDRGFAERIEQAKEAERYEAEILERERREAAQRLHQEEMEKTNATLRNTLNQLRETQEQLIQSEKMAALGDLVAGVAHEVNTPVGNAVTASTYLAEETQNLTKMYEAEEMTQDDFEQYLEVSQDSTRMILVNLTRSADLIKSFKHVAVDQSGEEKRRFAVKEYLDEILTSLGPKLKRTKHQVDVQCPADLVLYSFPGAFSQVVTNFIVNSLVHAYNAGDAGKMQLLLEPNGDSVDITYSDDGKGIPEEHLSHIFEPFYTTKRFDGGTGLGLHVTYNIVTQQLKGSIRCESTIGQGTTFLLKILKEV